MDKNQLYGLILEKIDSKLDVWLVYRENSYETVLGDGFYIYINAAFLNEDRAKEYAAAERRASMTASPEYGAHYYIYRARLFLEPRNYDPCVKFTEFVTVFDDACKKKRNRADNRRYRTEVEKLNEVFNIENIML